MNPTEVLTKEHVLIQLMLDIVEVALRRMELGGRPPREFFFRLLEFAEKFVTRFHHFKEEEVAFPRLAAKREELSGLVQALRFDHEHQLAHLSAIARALPGYHEGRDQETSTLLSDLAAFHSLLRRHIHQEDHLLFPALERELSETEQAELMDLLKKEIKEAGGNLFEKCQHLLLEMRALL